MGKSARRGLLAVLVLAPLLAGAWWFFVRPILDPLARGRSAYERGQWGEASEAASRRLKVAPNDPNALRLLARSDARAGRDTAAQRIFLRLGPESWQAEDFFLLATGMIRQGRTEVARNTLLNGWKADPSHPEVLEQLSRMTLQEGRPSDATFLARRLASLPGWASRGGVILAQALREQGEPAGAAEAIERAFDADPNLSGTGIIPAVARKAWAKDLLRIGKPAEARRRFEPPSRSEEDRETSWILSRVFLQEEAIGEAMAARIRAGAFGDDDPTRAEPAPFVGATNCASCHVGIYRSQRASRHASTLSSGLDFRGATPPHGSVKDPMLAGTEHTLRRDGEHLSYETKTEQGVYQGSIDYVFGSGGLGQTFVGADPAGQMREFRISSYAGGTAWGLTTGQNLKPSHPIERLGRSITDDELRQCLGCHTTRTSLKGGHPVPDTRDRGIGCEQCHGPGGHHLKAVAFKFPDLAIARPKLATAAKIVDLCGRCHSPPAGTSPPKATLPARFQAAGLKLSACYRESRGALSCVTCHDPHRDAERSPAFYEAKCRSCHQASPTSKSIGENEATRVPTVCPVNRVEGCVGCHMPSVVGPTPHTAFSNHNIQIHPHPSPR